MYRIIIYIYTAVTENSFRASVSINADYVNCTHDVYGQISKPDIMQLKAIFCWKSVDSNGWNFQTGCLLFLKAGIIFLGEFTRWGRPLDRGWFHWKNIVIGTDVCVHPHPHGHQPPQAISILICMVGSELKASDIHKLGEGPQRLLLRGGPDVWMKQRHSAGKQ